jgi:hypothetical protein
MKPYNPESRQFKALIHKLTYRQSLGWYGYLTSQEIVTLVDGGYVTHDKSDFWIGYEREKVKKGEGGGNWFYFQPTKKLQKYLTEQKTEHGRKPALKV